MNSERTVERTLSKDNFSNALSQFLQQMGEITHDETIEIISGVEELIPIKLKITKESEEVYRQSFNGKKKT